MAKTKLAKKRRLARAHEHQIITRNNSTLYPGPPAVSSSEAFREHERPLQERADEVRARNASVGQAFARLLGYDLTPAQEQVVEHMQDQRDHVVVQHLPIHEPTFTDEQVEEITAPSTHATTPAVDRNAPVKQPTRTKCSVCGFSQKVRKDGTMSRHDVFLGSDVVQCNGTGKRWDA